MRFNDEKWKSSSLFDEVETITDFVAAGSFADLRKKVKYYDVNKYAQLIRTTDLKNGFDSGVFVDEVAFNFLWRVNLDKECIVLPNIGANIGESYFINPANLPCSKNVLGPNAILLRTNSNNNYFIYSYFQTAKAIKEINKMVGASGQPKFNKTDLKQFKLFLPSRKTQDLIADCLKLVDQRIETQNKIIEDLQKIAGGLKNRFSCSTGKIIKIKDILEEINDKTTLNNQYSVLSSTVKGLFKQSDYFDRQVASENNVGYKIVRKGYIIISPQNLWMGNLTYNDKFEIGIVSPSYKVYKIKNGFDENLIFNKLTTKKLFYNYSQISEQGASIVRRNLNVEAFEQLPIICNKDADTKTINALLSINKKIENEKHYLNCLISQKQFLLRNLFI